MSEAVPLLQLENVSKSYESPAADAAPYVLKDVTLRVAAGESVSIVGPSGSGKSTLLNIIGALDRATRGRVLLAGEDLGKLNDKQLARIRNEKIGFVFQLHHLLNQCTVLENVLVPTLVRNDPARRQQAETRARRLLDRVHLAERLHYRPGQLSGGERQRVAVVRALINQPQLLLADEPTGSLDRENSLQLVELLAQLNRQEQVTLIVVTHAPDVARKMQRLLELRDGVLTPRENIT